MRLFPATLFVFACLLTLPFDDNGCFVLLAQDGTHTEPQRSASKTNSIGIQLALIQSGEFSMGSLDGEKAEQPQHTVKLTKSFYLGTTEVTVRQFRMFVEATKFTTYAERARKRDPRERGPVLTWRSPLFTQSDNDPVVHVAWSDAEAFCDWLSNKEGQDYRLPTEAEWEYACRAGSTTKWFCSDAEADLKEYAWYRDNANAKQTPHAVARKKPNAWGLYDMHGNVQEWCQDWYKEDYYATAPRENPTGPPTGSYRVIRGGSYGDGAIYCRAAFREGNKPGFHRSYLGFRVALSVSEK